MVYYKSFGRGRRYCGALRSFVALPYSKIVAFNLSNEIPFAVWNFYGQIVGWLQLKGTEMYSVVFELSSHYYYNLLYFCRQYYVGLYYLYPFIGNITHIIEGFV